MLKPKSMPCDIIYGMHFRLLAKDCVRKRIGQRPFSMLDMFKEVTFPQVKIHAEIQKNKYNAFISNIGFSFSISKKQHVAEACKNATGDPQPNRIMLYDAATDVDPSS